MIKSIWIASILFSLSVFAQDDFKSVQAAFTQAYEEERFSDAVSLAQQAMSLGEKKFKHDEKSLLNLKFNLANAFLKNRQYREAYSLSDELSDESKSVYGDVSFDVLLVEIQRMKAVERLSGSQSTYARRFQSAGRSVLQLTEKLLEQYKDNEEFTVHIYYTVFESFSEMYWAPVSFRRMVNFVETTEQQLIERFGQDDVKTVKVQYYLAQLYKSGKKSDRAIDKFEHLIGALDESLDYTHPYELGAHAQLVEIYEAKGKSDDATEHCIAIGRMTPWNDDLDPIPLYRKNPEYPRSLARLNREGWVRMSFDITPFGFVDNITVIESKGGEAFEGKSIEALNGWRYAPKFENGMAVVATNQTVQLDFRISR